MAHHKGGGSSRNGKDSNPQYLGVKAYGGEKVNPVASSLGKEEIVSGQGKT